ncbi:MAG: hypothetical protein MHM6MM_007601 [Cercozoa sp. M6MM]
MRFRYRLFACKARVNPSLCLFDAKYQYARSNRDKEGRTWQHHCIHLNDETGAKMSPSKACIAFHRRRAATNRKITDAELSEMPQRRRKILGRIITTANRPRETRDMVDTENRC